MAPTNPHRVAELVWSTAWRGTVAGAKRAVGVYLLLIAMFAGGLYFVVSDGFGSFPEVIFGLFLIPMGPVFYSSLVAHRRNGTRRARSLGLRDGRSAMFLPYSRLRWFGTPGIVAALMLISVLAPFGADAMPAASAGRYDDLFRALAFVSPVITIVCVLFFLRIPLLRKRRVLGIALGSDGAHHWSWRGCCFYEWKHIDGVSPRTLVGVRGIQLNTREPSERSEDAEENWASRSRRVRRALTWIPVDMFTVDPGLMLVTLSFYHRHPELREELGTEAALERIRSADFTDS